MKTTYKVNWCRTGDALQIEELNAFSVAESTLYVGKREGVPVAVSTKVKKYVPGSKLKTPRQESYQQSFPGVTKDLNNR